MNWITPATVSKAKTRMDMTWACSWSMRSSRFLAFISPPLFRFPLPPLPPWKQLWGVASQSRTRRMSSGEDKTLSESPNINAQLAQIQGMINSGPDGWEECWEQGLTPWDFGKPTPVIIDLLQTGKLPKGRTLVPGCGSGHDVVAIAEPERYVVGLDISETAVKKARELTSTLPNTNYFTFLKEDFFNWRPSELFDLIFDYTFFCAIEPDRRPAWAKQISDLLKPDGELITLMFPLDDHVGGPPYKVSVAEYEEVLNPVGFEAFYIEDNELAIEARKGREKLGRWKRSSKQSLL